MIDRAFQELLTRLHDSLERVAAEVETARPELARALKRQSAWIPRPEEISRTPASAERECRQLPGLLYQALDEGIVDGRQFDRMMIRQVQAKRALRKRETRRRYGVGGSPSVS